MFRRGCRTRLCRSNTGARKTVVTQQDEQDPRADVNDKLKSLRRRPKRAVAASKAEVAEAAAAVAPEAMTVSASESGRASYLRAAVGICASVVALIGIVYALHAGSELALPLALAIVLKLLFQPIARFLCSRLHLPQVVGALVIVIGLVGGVGALAMAVSGPASSWI